MNTMFGQAISGDPIVVFRGAAARMVRAKTRRRRSLRIAARPAPLVLSLSKDACAALRWFDKLTTNGEGFAAKELRLVLPSRAPSSCLRVFA
jgi:hypothetical protein